MFLNIVPSITFKTPGLTIPKPHFGVNNDRVSIRQN